MNRKTQSLRASVDHPVAIETAEGMIIISPADGRKSVRIVLNLPPTVTAHRSVDRAVREARFTTRTPDGRVIPKYSLLVPVLDEEGNLIGVSTPKVLKVRT